MAKITNRAAYEKVIHGRTNLLLTNGFFGYLALQLRVKEVVDDPTLDTAAVDGVTFFYNPKFVMQLTDREIEFLWAHEVMHCCFQHMTRRQSRDPIAWNVACDYVINLDLQGAGFTLINNRPINGRNFKIFVDKKFKGMTSE